MKDLIRAPRGTGRKVVPLLEIQIPDLWHVAMRLDAQDEKLVSKAVLDVWHLCHDLLEYAKGNAEYQKEE